MWWVTDIDSHFFGGVNTCKKFPKQPLVRKNAGVWLHEWPFQVLQVLDTKVMGSCTCTGESTRRRQCSARVTSTLVCWKCSCAQYKLHGLPDASYLKDENLVYWWIRAQCWNHIKIIKFVIVQFWRVDMLPFNWDFSVRLGQLEFHLN